MGASRQETDPMLQFIEQNFGVVVNLAILLGGGLIMVGAFKRELQALRDTQKAHEAGLAEITHDFNGHLQEDMPHRSCPVEASRTNDISQAVRALSRDVKRVEAWLMALASRQGIKEPYHNGDE
jgi:hypothetical protein